MAYSKIAGHHDITQSSYYQYPYTIGADREKSSTEVNYPTLLRSLRDAVRSLRVGLVSSLFLYPNPALRVEWCESVSLNSVSLTLT